jgi:CheY-like chemotaxis protein
LPLPSSEDTVIFAENDAQMRGVLRSILGQPGRTVLPCSNGLEAVELASQVLANLVLLDLRMPKMDGIEACRLIRELPRYADVPIVFLTVFKEAEDKRRAQAAGASRFLGKPFAAAEVTRVVNELLQAQRRKLELERY